MTTIDNIIARQHDLFLISTRSRKSAETQSFSNNARRRTKSHVLQTNWDKFQSYHDSLLKRVIPSEKLPYFISDLYSMCEEKFLDAHGTMIDMLENLDHNTNQNASAPKNL